MKLRIHASSIRLRLKQSEVAALVAGSPVSENCGVDGGGFSYALLPDPMAQELNARIQDSRLTIHVPGSWLPGWDTDDRVGFTATDGAVEVRIEKDFKCAHPDDLGDNEDCYENPNLCE